MYVTPRGLLEQGGRLVIYGAGRLGGDLAGYLLQAGGVEVVAFVDGHQRGERLGRPVLTPEQLFDELPRDAYDRVVVASMYALEIATGPLADSGIPFAVLVYQDWVLSFQRHPIDRAAAEQVAARLPEGERGLYRQVLDAWESGVPAALSRHWGERAMFRQMQYFDHLQPAPGEVVLEGGVFEGTSTLLLAAAVGRSGRVYAFDPYGDAKLLEQYRGQFAAVGNVEFVAKGLAAGEGRVRFQDCAAPYSRCLPEEQEGREMPAGIVEGEALIETTSIDRFVAERGLERVDQIKLDIEGMEGAALAGAAETIRRFRPRMALSVYHLPEHLYQLPLRLMELNPEYRLRFGHYSPIHSESILYFL